MQEYVNTDRQLHWLSQIIAKVNHTYVPVKKDDSHTNLFFDTVGNRLFGRWINTPKGKFILALNLNTLCFEWLDNKLSVKTSISVFDKEGPSIEKEIWEYPVSIGMSSKDISKPLHFEIPDYGFAMIKADEISSSGVEKWGYYRELANSACFSLSGYLQSESEIRIWPHHFDTGIYIQITDSLGFGFGWAMEDSMVGEPYFYLSGYKKPPPIKYENLSKLSVGGWVTGEHWNGAVLPLHILVDYSPAKASENINTYIKESIDWFLNL